MRSFIIRLVINMVALSVTASLLPGITIVGDDIGTLLLVAFIFGIVNALVRPILTFLSCPFVILTLGLFILVINGLLLLLTSSLSGGRLIVEGLGTAILGGIVMGITAMLVEVVLSAFGLDPDEEPRRAER